ncbi:hypothetical protein GQ43DRAFT_464779 [Delitschia confertaspora ATCC 74209]|uniref:Uncharacterized protein n=1 Tax=Delitschia confertaspora ATCC 74209 TaxID=1513339 RepID=A0A9P4JHF9_9PLEO|nr:hypothetical protein GQ43DRAFT_464779 [Delitschia confertaspora ATCC 74209]
MSINSATTSSHAELLPWRWTITANDPTVSCPSSSAILGTLAIVNILVSALSILFGNRRVLHWVFCRRWFKTLDSHAYRYMWAVNVGLQLGANALIAVIFQRAPGYHADFKVWELMLFFTVRPRLSWIALGLLGPLSLEKGEQITVELRRKASNRAYRARNFRNVRNTQSQPTTKEVWIPHFPWRSAAIAQIFSEIVLQCIALYIMGRTAYFASHHGFYNVTSTRYKELPDAAHLMYAGALFYLIVGSGMLIWEVIWLLMRVNAEDLEDGEKASGLGLFVIFNLFTTWLGSWIFWAGFVSLAGNLYCPPKLYAQGTIWAAFSLFGIMIGGGAG